MLSFACHTIVLLLGVVDIYNLPHFLLLASELNNFNSKMDTAERDYQQNAKRCEAELDKNLNRQQELEKELAQLKNTEKKYKKDLASGYTLQEEAVRAREKALGEMQEWSDKIEELRRRTQTALSVMDHMEGS